MGYVTYFSWLPISVDDCHIPIGYATEVEDLKFLFLKCGIFLFVDESSIILSIALYNIGRFREICWVEPI